MLFSFQKMMILDRKLFLKNRKWWQVLKTGWQFALCFDEFDLYGLKYNIIEVGMSHSIYSV